MLLFVCVALLLLLGAVDFFFIYRAQANIKIVGLSVDIVFGLEVRSHA